MKRTTLVALALAVVAIGVAAVTYRHFENPQAPVRFETATVTRADIVANVACTGTLQAIRTVDVGTQANGIIREINVDYDSLVHKGQVIARLDSSEIEAEIAQATAVVERLKANLVEFRVKSEEANRELKRSEALFAQHLIDQSDMDDARVAAEAAAADVKAGEDAIKQAQQDIVEDRLALDHTIIRAPVDGIVLARNVDIGQTVVSNMQAQSMFEIANDLSSMQLQLTVDESDVGRVRAGDSVTFTVESYPDRRYTGHVTRVRVGPTIDQNVVSYVTEVDVPNPDLTLRPGMTANANIRVASRAGAVAVATAALRFKPFDELFAALHQPVPSVPATLPDDTRVVWLLRNKQLVPVNVRFGVNDEKLTEIVEGLKAGDVLVANATLTR